MGARAQEAVTFCSKQTDIHLLRLLGILATGADDETGVIDPAPNRETLARLTNCTERTITNRIDKLIESGEIQQIRMGSGPGNPSAYRLLIEIPDSTLLRNGSAPNDTQKGEKGENLAHKVDQLAQEVAELRALFFTLLNRKGETEGAKGERVNPKGGKGESERVKASAELDADDPVIDPRRREEKEYIYTHGGSAYEHPPAPAAIAEEQQLEEMRAAISQVVKETYAPGANEEKFDNAAKAIQALGSSPGKVKGFDKWWEENGFYPGKASLSSFLTEYKNYLAGVAKKQKGHGHKNGRSPIPRIPEALRGIVKR